MTTRDELLSRYRDLSGEAEKLRHPDVEVLPPEATYIHAQCIDLLDELLSIVPSDAAMVGGLVRAMRRAKPMLLRDFAKVPPSHIVAFTHELAERMMRIGQPPIEAEASDTSHAERPESASA